MPTEKKIRAVEEMTATLARSSVVIGADYRGLKVEEATALRRALRAAGIEILVVKNTLFLRAAEAAGMPGVGELAEGPTAIIFGFDDPLTPIKTVVEYQRQSRNAFQARKAFMDGEVIPAGRLADLAALPPRNVMIAEFAGVLQSPIMTLVYLLTATLQEFSGLLDARTEQMDTGPSAGVTQDSQAEAATASADEPAAEAEETAPSAPEGPDGETAGPGDESSTEEEAGEEDGN
jgi:large subunit ribosomal protein L10